MCKPTDAGYVGLPVNWWLSWWRQAGGQQERWALPGSAGDVINVVKCPQTDGATPSPQRVSCFINTRHTITGSCTGGKSTWLRDRHQLFLTLEFILPPNCKLELTNMIMSSQLRFIWSGSSVDNYLSHLFDLHIFDVSPPDSFEVNN